MSAVPDVSLRQTPPPEETRQFNARLPLRALSYIKREATGEKTQASVVTDALELDRVLAERLAPHVAKLQAFAEENGLSLATDLGEVLSRLVIAGLSAKPSRR